MHVIVCRSFVDFLKDREKFSKKIDPEDVDVARRALIRKAQIEGFPDEYHALCKGKVVEKQSPIHKLMPFLDEHKILRSRSRLENIAAISMTTRLPILLPQKPRIVKL